MSGDGQEPSDPGGTRLLGYLEELREDPPETDRPLSGRVHRSARWQQAVRAPLQLIGSLAGALVDGISGLVGPARRSGR